MDLKGTSKSKSECFSIKILYCCTSLRMLLPQEYHESKVSSRYYQFVVNPTNINIVCNASISSEVDTSLIYCSTMDHNT